MPTDDEFRSMSDTELRDWYETELRAKYNQDDRDTMAKSGEAMHDGSYPIKDEDDLKNAIRAVGRGGASHNAIRAHIIARAKALELSNLIPENWADDGSLKNARSTSRSMEWRRGRAEQLETKAPERRLAIDLVELRADPDDGLIHFNGYASVTESPYDMGWYNETIDRGAFKKTLASKPDVVLNLGHGTNGSGLPIARTTAGNLQLKEDSKGLRVDAQLDPEDPDVQLLKRKYDNKNLDGQMSFAFRAERQEWNDDYTERHITEANVHRGDVSIVTQGANPVTSSSIRSEDALMALRHLTPAGVVDGLLEWRRMYLCPMEERVGKTHSNATVEVLTQVLNLCAISDDAMDQAQPLLAELLGVTNPDDDDAYAQTRDSTQCPNDDCGAMNDSEAQYCDQCGSAMSDDDSEDENDDSDEELAAPDDFELRLAILRQKDVAA